MTTIGFIGVCLISCLVFSGFSVNLRVERVTIIYVALFFTMVITGIVNSTLPVVTGVLGTSPTIVTDPFVAAVISTMSLVMCFGITVSLLGVWERLPLVYASGIEHF